MALVLHIGLSRPLSFLFSSTFSFFPLLGGNFLFVGNNHLEKNSLIFPIIFLLFLVFFLPLCGP